MSLSSAFEIAKISIYDHARNTSVTAKNISSANDKYYSRNVYYPTAIINSRMGSTVIRESNLAADKVLYRAHSLASFSQTQNDLVSSIDRNYFDASHEISVFQQFNKVKSSLIEFSADTSSNISGQKVLLTTNNLVDSLNEISSKISQVAHAAISNIENDVALLNRMILDIDALNTKIARDMHLGSAEIDLIDQRNKLVIELSQKIAIDIRERADHKIDIYTANQIPILVEQPRRFEFIPAATINSEFLIPQINLDGVPLISSSSDLTAIGGSIGGASHLLYHFVGNASAEIDTIADHLIYIFKEQKYNSTNSQNDVPGYLNYHNPLNEFGIEERQGRAAYLKAFSRTDAAQNLVRLLRDGGFADPNDSDYNLNRDNAEIFSVRIDQILDRIDDKIFATHSDSQVIDNNLSSSIIYGSVSVLSLMETIDGASRDDMRALDRTFEIYRNQAGVDLDQEAAQLMALEVSYQSTARLMKIIADMYAILLNSIE